VVVAEEAVQVYLENVDHQAHLEYLALLVTEMGALNLMGLT